MDKDLNLIIEVLQRYAARGYRLESFFYNFKLVTPTMEREIYNSSYNLNFSDVGSILGFVVCDATKLADTVKNGH